MDRPPHPVKTWMQSNGYDLDSLSAELVERFGAKITRESLRMILGGYRLPSWELAFDLEALTGLSAHDIRDEKWYATGEAA